MSGTAIHILMTGAGAPGAAGILHCLQQDPDLNILLADADPQATGKYLHPHFRRIPAANKDPHAFVTAILELVQTEKIQVLLPLVTRELELLSAIKKELAAIGCAVLVSDISGLRIANDKGLLYTFLSEKGIPVPDFRIAATFPEWEAAVKALGYPNEPVCFKPCVANGSRGFRILDPHKDEWDLLFNHKPDQSWMSYDKAASILQQRDFPTLVVSEYLPGVEYSIDCLADKGVCKIAIPRARLKMTGGISTKGRFDQLPELEEYCAAIIAAIGLHGNIGIQVKADKNGQFRILEINPRVQGTIVSNLGIGINLPLLAIYQGLGRPISIDKENITWGLHFSRYWEEVYYRP